MSMKRWFAAAGLACLIAPAVMAEEPVATAPGHYTLRRDSMHEEGCFAPCMCPIMIRGQVHGRFRLLFERFDGVFRHFRVDELKWVVHDPGNDPNQDTRVTGSGTYLLESAPSPRHQLTLDLEVGSDPVQRFDSGLVPAPTRFPGIDARISINGEYCWDQVFDLHARRTRALGVDAASVVWETEPAVSGHDVVMGSLSELRRSNGDFGVSVMGCAARATTAAGIPSGPDPPIGEGYWFLLRDVEEGVAGSYDSGEAAQAGSADAGIAASPVSCP